MKALNQAVDEDFSIIKLITTHHKICDNWIQLRFSVQIDPLESNETKWSVCKQWQQTHQN